MSASADILNDHTRGDEVDQQPAAAGRRRDFVDGETWARQRIDFSGLPEMVRTFLQMAAGAADTPVTRLLGQSPAGLSATGDSDTRKDDDMIAARQELDLRPQLERLDALLLRAAGVDPASV